MSTFSFTGGTKLRAKLEELARKANKDALLRVGFFEGSTENKSGVSTPMVAAINEFGGTIPERTVPAHKTTIYRRVGKDGELLNGAKFVRRSQSNFATEHDVPEHVIPEHKIPSRPFFRRMIKLGSPHWGDDLGAMLKHHELDAERALNELGEQMTGELQKSIGDPVYTPNAPSTVAKKGHDQTLIDSGDMQNAVHFQIES